MRSELVAALVMSVALLSSPLGAQVSSGRLQGVVRDAQQGVLPGVTVTAEAPSLIGSQTAITEADGQYRFPALPGGRYTLTFELPGFQTVIREGIVLALGQTLNVDAALQVASLEETVTVSGQAPIVDTSSTAVGSVFNAEALASVPSATDLWATLSQAPGVRMLGFDVGGSHKSQQVGYESFGIRNQNQVVTDGVDTTEGTGGAGFYQDFFAHEEVSVAAAGGDVSMMTPGSAVFSTIKSGGNEFRSLNNFSWEDGSFVGDNLDEELRQRGDTGQPNLEFWEFHTDIGGPIKRDRVWFYTAYNHFKIDKQISGVPVDLATDLGEFDNFTAKATAKLSSKDTVIGYYQWGRKSKPSRGLSNTIGPDSILAQKSDSWMYNGQHQRVWTNRMFTDVRVGLFGFGWPMEPAVPFATNPPRQDTGTGVQSGAGWLAGDAGGPFTFDRNKPQVHATLTYFLPEKAGSHDIKAGFEILDDQSKFGNNGSSGQILYLDLNGAINNIRLTDLGNFADFGTGWTSADDRNRRVAFYLQDRWSVNNRLTITAGVRYDRQRPHYEDSIRTPVLSAIFPAATVPGATLLTSNTVSPRVGVSFSPTGDSRTVIKGFYGRFYQNFADRLSNVNPGGTNTRTFVFSDLNGNRLFDGPQELGTLVASAGGTSTTLDPDLKTPFVDEFNVSYEHQFWGESSFRVAYVRKQARDEFTTFNVLREGQFTVPRTTTVDERDFVNGVTGQRTFTVFDIPDSLRGQVQNVVTNIPDSVGGGSNDYDTIQFAVNKRFASGLFFQSSFDYQWRDELRSTAATTSPLNSDPLGIGFAQGMQVFPDVSNRQESTNWQFRALGRYVFPYEVGFATNVRVQSGWQYARIFQVALPNAGTQAFFAEDIDNNRSDTIGLVDVRVDKSVRFGGRYRASIALDVFNLLNTNNVSNFNLLNGAQFNRVIASLDPRTAMLAFRFDF